MAAEDREKALDTALAQIERQFGKGSVMRLGDESRAPVEAIPTGSIALDCALGVGGLPRGRVVECYGPESSGKSTLALHVVANAQKNGGIAAFVDAEHALDPEYAKKLGVDIDALLVSQPDTGEQALEITDMLIRSGAIDLIVIDSVAALVPRAEIEGEMGDSHVGLQARLMSQALRKVTGALSNSGTTALFINQLREKVGVMFGCGSWSTQVTLADGTQVPLGKLVNQRMDVEVLSYDTDLGKVVPKKVISWFNNGPADEFLKIRAERPAGGTGRSYANLAMTRNHPIATPSGWCEAGDISVGDHVLLSQPYRLSEFQWEVIRGALMGDGALSEPVKRDGLSARFRMGHGAKQVSYLEWKSSLFDNIGQSRSTNTKGSVFIDLQPLPELAELRDTVYNSGQKVLSQEYLKALSPLSLAIWYMDDGGFTLRTEGKQARTAGGKGRSEICVQAMSPNSRERFLEYLQDTFDLYPKLTTKGKRQIAFLLFDQKETEKFHTLIAPYVHSSMAHKLLPWLRGQFNVEPEFTDPVMYPVPARVVQVDSRSDYQNMSRFDIEVEGSHNYLADGVIVHNSPETTTGGRALKFYSSVRLDIRRIETLKDGSEAIGNRTRVKVAKNKTAPPFRSADFDIIYNQGISREGGLIDMGVEHGFVRKSGAWYTYENDQLGQGKENARVFLKNNPDIADEIEGKIKDKLGITKSAGSDDADPSQQAATEQNGQSTLPQSGGGSASGQSAGKQAGTKPSTSRAAASRATSRSPSGGASETVSGSNGDKKG